MNIDVTDKVKFENNDDESLPIIRCICGEKFDPWHFIISPDFPNECPNCKRKFIFKNTIKVYEVID